MRVLPLLVTTLLFAVPVFAQQASSTNSTPAQSTAAVAEKPPAKAITVNLYPPPAHPITPAQVHELLELTGANKLARQVMHGMWSNIQKTFPPFIPKDVRDDLELSIMKINFEPLAIQAYQKHISTQDAAQVIAFYKTPAGQRLVGVLPEITREMQENSEKLGTQVVREVIARHMDEIKTAEAKYRTEHSDTPKITTN